MTDAVAGAAEVGRHLLGPREGRVEGDRPAGGHVREGFRTAPLVDQRDEVLHLLGHAVEIGHLVVHADEAALGAGAVVAGDVDEQRVVELADVLQRLHEPPDLVIGVLQESREHLGLAGEQTPLVRRQRVPGLDVLRPGRPAGCSPGSRPASSAARAFRCGPGPSPCRTGPCTCPPTPSARGAAHGPRRSRSRRRTACPASSTAGPSPS